MGRMTLLALLFGAIVGCNETGKGTTDASGRVPSSPSQPALVGPDYAGVWDAQAQSNQSSCPPSPGVLTPAGHSMLGGTIHIDDQKNFSIGINEPTYDDWSFDGTYIMHQGYAWTWAQATRDLATVTYFEGCWFQFKRRGT